MVGTTPTGRLRTAQLDKNTENTLLLLHYSLAHWGRTFPKSRRNETGRRKGVEAIRRFERRGEPGTKQGECQLHTVFSLQSFRAVT